jgi:hypothetical protein
MNFAFRALTKLHQFLAPTAHRNLFEDISMSKSFCNTCYKHDCQHCEPRRHNVIDLGEHIGDNIEHISALGPSNLSPPFRHSPRRTILPPPPPDIKSTALVPRFPDPTEAIPAKPSIIVDTKLVNFVACSICNCKVKIEYLTQHLSMHTHNFTPKVKPMEQATALATIPHTPLLSRTVETSKDKTRIPQLKAVENFKFRQLDSVCAASSADQSGRYSDFTVSFFIKEKTTFSDTTWKGGGQYATKDIERFVVHIAYDSVEDYYLVVCKMVKRSQYTSYDNEEPAPEHICYQNELITDIKRTMLFFGIPPRTAYKMFRKLFKKNSINTEYDKNDRACMSETSNSGELTKKLAPKEYSYSAYEGHME